MLNRILVFYCGMSLLMPVAYAGAITAADEARAMASLARDEARSVADRAATEASLAEAQAAVAEFEAEVAKLEVAVAEAEALAAAAEEAAVKAEALAAEAEAAAANVDIEAAKAAVEKARIAVERETKAEEAAARAAEAGVAARAAAAAAAALIIVAENEAKTDEAAAEAQAATERAYALAEAKMLAAEKRVNEAWDALAEAEARLDAAEELIDIALDAREAAKDARADAIDAQSDLEDAKADLTVAKADLEDAKTWVAEEQALLNPVTRGRFFAGEMKYYHWRDDQGRSGYQFYQPYTFSYINDDMEYSLSTGYLISENKSAAAGRVKTWTDTLLSVAKENRNEKYSVRYSLDINVPTGKADLYGTGAVMPDDLVEFSRFGEGWNYIPGVSVSRRISKEDTWTFGTYYSFRGSYTYDRSIANGRINPGNEWGKMLRWQHAEQKWQLIGELTHTSFGSTTESDIDYREGSGWEAKLIYNRVLPKDQNLMLYYWYAIDNAYSSSDPVAAGLEGTTDLHTHYFGAMWSKTLDERRTFRIMTDIMRRSGSSYDPLTTLSINGRSKYTIGLGYDFDFTPDRRLSFDVANFYMKDKSPANGFHGYNISLMYSADM